MSDNLKTILNRNPKKILKILMGDFNTDAVNNKIDYDIILSEGLYDTYNMAEKKDDGITVNKNIDGWKDSKNEMRIDYVFANKEIKVKESKVIFNGKNYPVVSDHYGIEVEIDL